MLAYADLSLMVKAGVQWGFRRRGAGAGYRGHHRDYLPSIMTFELPGCFGDDGGHGSNVAGWKHRDLRRGRRRVVVHSPTPSARRTTSATPQGRPPGQWYSRS